MKFIRLTNFIGIMKNSKVIWNEYKRVSTELWSELKKIQTIKRNEAFRKRVDYIMQKPI